MTRLLIYSHFFAPSTGGVETVVLALAKGLVELPAPFDVTVVTQTPAGDFQDETLPHRIVRNPALITLWKLIQEADLVHIAGTALPPMILSLLTGKPTVVEHHGFQSICPTGQLLLEPENTPCPGHFMAGRHRFCLRCQPKSAPFTSLRLWLLTFLRRRLCQQVSLNLVPTHWLGGLIQLPRTEAVPHGVSVTSSVREKASIKPANPKIVFIGRLVITKGVQILLEAARRLQEQQHTFDLVIVGDGPERGTLEKFCKDHQLTSLVSFLGEVPQASLDEVFSHARAVVVPSLGGEVFGMVIAENMARRLPLVASDLGAFIEVMGDAGISFKTGDATDLAAKLAPLLKQQDLADKLADTALQRAKQCFTQAEMINGHARIYHRMLGSSVLPETRS